MNLKHYLDPQDKGWISPCDLFRLLCYAIFWGFVALVYFCTALNLAAPIMCYIYGTKDLNYIDVMPWYGCILAPLIGTAVMGFFVLIIIAVCKFHYYLEENNYTCPNFGIRKKLCKIKLWKLR